MAHAAERLLDEQDALGLASLVKAGEVSPAELLEAAIDRAEARDPQFNFMAQRHYEYARATVARGVPDGPLAGVPWLLKDLNTYIEGEPTENGSRLYRGNRATQTSELVRRIERAGMVIFGKTTTPEFGLTGTTESALCGVTRNPWSPEHIAGGSSGGAAAAVAAGVVPAAHATDGGGSIRIPASCCGLFGLKPSRGRVPMGPARTEGWGGLSAHHAVTRSVRDSAAILDATHGIEPGSRYGAPAPAETFLSQVGRDPGRLRIALTTTAPSGTPVDPECVEATRAAARLCESLGHIVEEVTPPIDAAAYGQASFVLIAASVAADCEQRAAALGKALDTDLVEPMTLGFIDYGRNATGMDFARANATVQEIAVKLAGFMTDYDVILSPTIGTLPLEIGAISLTPTSDFETWGRVASTFAAFTGVYNGTGQPSMSVPLGMSAGGLPVGVMFTARYAEEVLLFRLAAQLEQAAPWAGRRAPA